MPRRANPPFAVYLAVDNHTGQKVAVKRIKFEDDDGYQTCTVPTFVLVRRTKEMWRAVASPTPLHPSARLQRLSYSATTHTVGLVQ